jgi:hypothetical protein
MNKERADQMLIDIHGDVKVIRKTQADHGQTLYGPDGNSGVTKELTLVKERQDQCPARQAASEGGKHLKLATVIMILAILAIVADVVIGIFF